MNTIKYIPFFAFVVLVAGLAGCYKDDSSEIYQPVNEIMLSDSLTAEPVSVVQGQTLELNPVLTRSMEEEKGRLKYIWALYLDNPNISYVQPYDTVSMDKELSLLIQEPLFTLGESYRLIFSARDTVTGITAYLAYDLDVVNVYDEGLLVLEDENGLGDFSFIFPDGEVEHDFYSSRNSTPLVEPRKIELTPFNVTDDISSPGKRLYILSKEGSQEYNYVTMVKKYDYDYLFFFAPEVENPQRLTWTSSTTAPWTMSASLGIGINNGWVHSNLVGGFPGIKKWGDATVSPEGNLNYSVSPFVAGGTTYGAVVYDNTGERFLSVGGTSLAQFPTAANTEFDMNNVGMQLVYMDSANVEREYNAIMKDDAGDPWLFRFRTNNTAASLSKTAMNAPGILDMSAAAGATATPHIFYGNGSRLNRYETTSNSYSNVFSFPAGENISAMKYLKSVPGESSPRLMVATWNGTEGKLYYFPVSATGGISTYSEIFTGFAKIIDLVYKVP